MRRSLLHALLLDVELLLSARAGRAPARARLLAGGVAAVLASLTLWQIASF